MESWTACLRISRLHKARQTLWETLIKKKSLQDHDVILFEQKPASSLRRTKKPNEGTHWNVGKPSSNPFSNYFARSRTGQESWSPLLKTSLSTSLLMARAVTWCAGKWQEPWTFISILVEALDTRLLAHVEVCAAVSFSIESLIKV